MIHAVGTKKLDMHTVSYSKMNINEYNIHCNYTVKGIEMAQSCTNMYKLTLTYRKMGDQTHCWG